ncbi:MAG: ABC transporter ATP-binding protein [Verrucomicrobiae bacterium]
MILETRAVSKRFGGLQALKEISFAIREGEILGLIGPNGAGKTTLFNTINGVFRPDKGRVIFRGEDLTGHPPWVAARRGMARTYQIVRPLKELTVLENVIAGACFGLHALSIGKAEDVAAEVLGMLGLAGHGRQPAGSLNVAEKKRLELARSLAARPHLLLLDEVLAGLNPSEISGMVETILKIRESGITILMIEHVMQAVMKVSDRLIVLDDGELIAEGRPSEIMNNPRVVHAYLGDPRAAERLMSASATKS